MIGLYFLKINEYIKNCFGGGVVGGDVSKAKLGIFPKFDMVSPKGSPSLF